MRQSSFHAASPMTGVITACQTFLFPDTPSDTLPGTLRAAMAKNGFFGIQLLIDCPQGSVNISLAGEDSACFEQEWFEMVGVPVEYNTGDGVNQGGAMVILPPEKPDYAIRKAPFFVYDCLRPCLPGSLSAKDGRVSAYLRLTARDGLLPRDYAFTLRISDGTQTHECAVTCAVYPVAYDEDLFETTNWFSVAAMEQMHGVTRGTPAFYDVVRAYARSMRSVHQKVFLLWMHEDLSERRTKKPYHFDFEDMKPIVRIFFEEGFDTFETGGIICRGYRADGSVDMYTADLKCSADPSVSVDSEEGRALLTAELQAFSSFLARNGWTDRVLFHVLDEPDVHYLTQEDLMARHRQFAIAAGIVRAHLPGVRIIEAVKTTLFQDEIDILVPITDGYQSNKEEFDAMTAAGKTLWTYVCCAPTGKWLNRFLDQPLLNGRLLFWGCAANRIEGYLHWGYNQFSGVPDPFTATSAKNWTGIGTNFPCGDAFIVYPGKDGPWPSMRLEAERMGAQDAALLRALREKDESAHDALLGGVFTAFDRYTSDPALLSEAHEALLRLLCR